MTNLHVNFSFEIMKYSQHCSQIRKENLIIYKTRMDNNIISAFG